MGRLVQVENVFVLAGVPTVMHRRCFEHHNKGKVRGGQPTRSLTLGAYLSEGQIGKKLGIIQENHPNIDLGVTPFTTRTDMAQIW